LKCQDEDEEDETAATGKSRGATGRKMGGIPAVIIPKLFIFSLVVGSLHVLEIFQH